MTGAQVMTQAIMQAAVEAVNIVVQAMIVARVEARTRSRNEAASMGPRLGGPSLKQRSFHWSVTDKYTELRNFRLEVNNIFQT